MTDAAATLLEKNMGWLAAHHPDLMGALNGYKPMSKLTDEDDGWHNIEFSGQKLYSPSAKEYIEGQLDAYFEAPYTINFSPLQPEGFDRFAGTFVHDFIAAIAEAEIVIHRLSQRKQPFYLLAFGLGTGQHLERLVKETKCNTLLIVEPNLDFIYHAMHVVDFTALHEQLETRDGQIAFIFGDSAKQPDTIFDQLRYTVRTLNPCSVDGSMFMFHYANDIFLASKNRIEASVNVLITGLGFYFDEVVMLSNTYANLRDGNAKMIDYAPNSALSVPAFIVGSGPSLDKTIDVIKENQGKAIIFSCGTALRPLLKAGITPDFHVETENHSEIVRIMEILTKTEDLSDVHFLTSTTVDPRVPKYFGDTSYYFRPGLSNFPVFKRKRMDRPLLHCDPTVTNAALALAQNFGFREMYFFGVDLGARRGALLHSKDAWQNTDDGEEVKVAWDNPAPGNFGGEVMCSNDMMWAREEVELAIKYFQRGRVYYNCSDGAMIKRAIAKHARTVKLPDVPKSDIVKTLRGYYLPYTKADLDAQWSDETMAARANKLCDDMLDIISDAESVASKHYLSKANTVINSTGTPVDFEDGALLGLKMIFRGSMWQGLIGAEYYLNRAAEGDDYEKCVSIFQKHYAELIEKLRELYMNDLGNLSTQPWKPLDRSMGMFMAPEFDQDDNDEKA